MHPQVAEFIQSTTAIIPWENAKVIEVGAQDVNGATRDLIRPPDGEPPYAAWTGIDLVPGPGVDLVGEAAQILAGMTKKYDVAIATELLEHTENWADIITGMISVLNPSGWLVITCAAPGRPPHAASGGAWQDGTEWYQNVSIADLTKITENLGLHTVTAEQTTAHPCDTHYAGQLR